jgi:glutamine synthetase
VDIKTRKNIFSNPDGTPSPLFFLHRRPAEVPPAALALLCANVNSYRR